MGYFWGTILPYPIFYGDKTHHFFQDSNLWFEGRKIPDQTPDFVQRIPARCRDRMKDNRILPQYINQAMKPYIDIVDSIKASEMSKMNFLD